MPVTPASALGAAGITSAASLLGSGGSSIGGSQGSSASTGRSFSQTYGTEASQRAAIAANNANNAGIAAWERAAAYNAEEAQKQRDWAEKMANTTYQRTMADMKAAGINPVLAAQLGLSADSVTSGATASMGNPMSYMANTYADSQSASQNDSWSQNSSFNQSLSGLAYLADAISNAITNMNSAMNINIALDGLEKTYDQTTDKMSNSKNNKWSNYWNKIAKNSKEAIGDSKLLKWLNGLQIKATGANPG